MFPAAQGLVHPPTPTRQDSLRFSLSTCPGPLLPGTPRTVWISRSFYKVAMAKKWSDYGPLSKATGDTTSLDTEERTASGNTKLCQPDSRDAQRPFCILAFSG